MRICAVAANLVSASKIKIGTRLTESIKMHARAFGGNSKQADKLTMKIVTTKQLAAAIGRTPTRVCQLYRSGIIGGFAGSHGRSRIWPLWESVSDFARYKAESRHPGRPSVGERDEANVQSIFTF
jgi:hypothetical protein